ncbi:MAG: hypothetical protein LKF42_05310 [Streptococcaceae bacterium]|nr:hypothetical protein [Streptococcaceae bacterium]MCH4176835.1 hypothetical protein [Streptococcaceae bacterium]
MLKYLVILIVFSFILASICLGLAIYLFFKYQINYIFQRLGYLRKLQSIVNYFQRCFQRIQFFFRKNEKISINQQAQKSPNNPDSSMKRSVLKNHLDKNDLEILFPNTIQESPADQTVQLAKKYFIISKTVISLASNEKIDNN